MGRERFIQNTKTRRGFTLAESLIASVVLAVAAVAVSRTILSSETQTISQENTAAAVALARELMEEICARPLTLPDATPGWLGSVTNRALYDTVDDYRGYTDVVNSSVERVASSSQGTFSSANVSATPINNGSTPMPVGQRLTRVVSVTYPTTLFSVNDASGDFAIVTVTVTGMGGAKVKLTRLVTKVSVTR